MKIGICGKSGSGKSTASLYFQKKGYSVIDLDQLAKGLDVKYPEIITRIENEFGTQYISDGKINRKMLGQFVFSSEKDLNKLNEIYFEYIKKDALEEISKIENIVIEGAILFEIELEMHLDKTIYVTVNEEILLERIAKREKSTIETLKNRLKIQKKYDAYINKADYIIETNSTKKELYEKLSSLGL
ncbi:MAG: dephospho-CoA kinase [Candidatus Delongbacteria bacterium]|jgi:dephospho-CoA kinase|nr:dephospho-CoA kinase [Candidatus Delongbacteria bacterium]